MSILTSKKDIEFANNLAAGGLEFDRGIHRQVINLIKEFPDSNPFIISIALSLTWTGHATDKADYFMNSIEFLNTSSNNFLSRLSKSSGRYGQEALNNILANWYNLIKILKLPDNFVKSKVEEIVSFQSNSLNAICSLRQKRQIMYIGAWLFCAPFKIILCWRDDLWKESRINNVLMPLGMEVVRGINKMKNKGYGYARDIEGTLSEEEGDVVVGLGSVHLVQSMCKRIASDANSNVLHINSGLWQFGAGEILAN